MSLQKWELSHLPSEKDKNRWRLKVKIEEKELLAFMNTIPGTVGRPFLLENEAYDFGFYLYELGESELQKVRSLLDAASPNGVFKGPGKEESLDSLLENMVKVLDDTSAPQPAKPAPAPAPAPKPQPAPEPVAPKPAPAPTPVLDLKKVTDPKEFLDLKKATDWSTPPAKKEAAPAPAADAPKPQPAAPAEPVAPVQPSAPVQPAPAQPAQAQPAAGAVDFQDMDLNKSYTFEEFIIGPNNRFTAAAAQAVADNPGKIYNPFFIYGGVGLGKTHLMHAVGHYVKKKSPGLRSMYVTTEKFKGDVIDALRKGTLSDLREHYREVDLLMVDDIQFLVESESTQEEFFHIFNLLHQNGKQIIITSDRPPKQLITLEDRLRSRFEWGLIADIKSPNLETRVAILKKKGENENLKLDDNILLYIASKLKSNIRELEGFLKRINAYASLTHQEVNMELAQSLMADLLPVEEAEEAAAAPAAAESPASAAPVPPPQPPAAAQPSPVPPPAAVPPPVPPPAEPPRPPVMAAPVPPPMPPPTPAPMPPPAPKPVAPPMPSSSSVSDAANKTDPGVESNLKPVEVGFFFPEGKEAELAKVKEHFREVIRKHKLKFRLEGKFERSYAFQGKIVYAFFSELCKTGNVGIAIVLGPPVESGVEAEDFANLLSTVMDEEHISLQLVSWAELNKDYRYLNLALDITLLKHKG